MDVVYARCAGVDVHKEFVQVCVRMLDDEGRMGEEVRKFSTMTADLLRMGDWFSECGVTHVAMESTGVLWKPLYNLLSDRFTVLVCNAQHLKQVPGRKTDIKDCKWIAQLLSCGLLQASFVPPRPVRELRDLTRHRAQLVGEQTRVKNRIHKTLEDTNIKLDCVASDLLGVSGRAILEALCNGTSDARLLADLARGRLRAKREALELALQGHVREHHRFMLKVLLEQLTSVEQLIARMDERIGEVMTREHEDAHPFEVTVTLLTDIPGVNRDVARAIVAEIGTDMSQFPSAGHLASWAGICPGSNESAGKRKSGKTTKGNRWLKRALTQAAWGASRTKKTYYNSQFRRLAARRGTKRALVAVAHSLLVTIYAMIKTGALYTELGAGHFDSLNVERLTRYHLKRLAALGINVEIRKAA